MTNIKITELSNIGGNIAANSLVPVVDMSGTPTTKKANLQVVGNLMLSGAGGANFPPAGRAVLAQTVTNAAQPNITSVGTLTGLAVTGNITTGNISGNVVVAVANLKVSGGTSGYVLQTDGAGNLSWTAQTGGGGGSYSNANVASYLPTFTGTVGANRISSNAASGNNLQINANGAVFTFNSEGEFTAPGNVNLQGTRLNVGPGAANVPITTNPTLVVTDDGLEFIQAALLNENPNGSSDYAAYGAGSDETQGFADLGFAGPTFNDPNYSITPPGDGYVFVQGYANGLGGALTLATGQNGNTPDIIFATGGFTSGAEFGRIDHGNNLLYLSRSGAGIKFSDGSIQTTAGGAGTGDITFNGPNISTNIADGNINIVGSASGNIVLNSNNHIFLHVDDSVDPHGGVDMTWARTSNGVAQTAGISINSDFGNNQVATGNVQIVACGNLANGLADSSWTFGTDGKLTWPGVGAKYLGNGAAGEFEVHSDTNVVIGTDIGNSDRLFVFDQSGDFFAPGNVTIDGTEVFVGTGANTLTSLLGATLIISSNSNSYVQSVINNVTDIGSADWVAQGRLGGDEGGYIDLGFNGSGFNDPEYSSMGPGDGYVYVEGYAEGQAPSPTGGNLVLGTGSQGNTRDVIFTTGGHTANDIIARFSDANNAFELSRANAVMKFPDGSTQTTAYTGGANTGNVTFDDNIVIGTGDEFGGDGLFLAPGNGSIANSAVQYLRVRGGDYPTHIHLDTGNNQYYDQYFGADGRYVKLEANGNVVLNADDYLGNSATWTLTTDGNLILAGGNSVIQSIANSSLDPVNPNVSTMVLTPDPGYSTQSLVLDPTAPGHIHLRAPGANIDEPSANIFLGGETSSFEVGYYNGAAPNLFIHSANNTWTFDTTGNLTLPRDGSNISTDPYLKILGGPSPQILSEDASLAGPANLAIVTDYLNLSGSTGNRIILQADAGAIATDAAMVLSTNLADPGNIVSWTLDTTGNLYLPDTTSVIANVSITLEANDSGNITGLSVTGDANANLYAHGNVTIVSDSSNTNATWAFGTNGNLTVPGSLINDTSMVLSAPSIFNICTISTAGSGYNTGSSLKATTGGSGTGMTVGIGYGLSNQLTSVNVVNPGTGYVNGDVITVSEGTGGTFVLTKYNQSANQTNNNTIQTDFTFANSTVTLPIYGEMATDASMTLTTNLANTGNTSSWTFGDDGLLTLPGGNVVIGSVLGGEAILASNTPFGVVSQGNGSTVIQWIDNIANATALSAIYINSPSGNTGDVAVLTGEPGANANIWTFGADGILTVPGNLVAVSASPAPVISGFSSVSALQFTNGNSNVTVNANSNLWNFDSTGNLIIPGSSGGFIKTVSNASIGIAAVDNGTNNPAQLLSLNSGSGAATSIVSAYSTNVAIQTNAAGAINTWSFSADGNLTLPGNTVAIKFANNSSAFGNMVQWTTAPLANTSAGTAGQAAYDAGGNLYVCVAANTWSKFAGTTSW